MTDTSAVLLICSNCGCLIRDPQHVIVNGLHYHSNHAPMFDCQPVTATEWSEREHERRVKMAKAVSFIMVGTEERYPDWLNVADFFINQLRNELARADDVSARRTAMGRPSAVNQDNLSLNEIRLILERTGHICSLRGIDEAANKIWERISTYIEKTENRIIDAEFKKTDIINHLKRIIETSEQKED